MGVLPTGRVADAIGALVAVGVDGRGAEGAALPLRVAVGTDVFAGFGVCVAATSPRGVTKAEFDLAGEVTLARAVLVTATVPVTPMADV
ncbi:MAG: hypothetical protein HYX94_06215 [Chloroflexi bacterium]|nr:hypothetical protein [Chloroflexota bacterium]